MQAFSFFFWEPKPKPVTRETDSGNYPFVKKIWKKLIIYLCLDYSLGNIITENAPGVGGWGGYCTCPDGQVYGVGDNHNWCGSLACVNGVAGGCNRRENNAWRGRKVVCANKGTNFIFQNGH